MTVGKLDDLIMLLSTDWFSPYWLMLGIQMEGETRLCFREGCREIVKQILSGAREYYDRSYSEERLAHTRSMLEFLLQKCQADPATIDKISALARDEENRITDQPTAWLALVITQQLLQNSMGESPSLDSDLKQAVSTTWETLNRSEFPEPDFEQVCLGSKSEWDVFTRSRTPDEPAMLSDFMSSLASEEKFEQFWTAVRAKLSLGERRELLNWYRKVGESMTGEPLRLPQEV